MLQMAKTRHGKTPDESFQEEEGPEVIEVSDTTAGASTSPEDNPNEDYVDQLGMLSQLWLDNVRNSQEEAYRELLEQLLSLAHEIYPLLADADAEAVLGCIQDTSGHYLVGERGFVLQVTKDDAIIRRKRWSRLGRTADKEDVKKTLDEYYHEADALAQAQNKAMDTIDELGEVVDDHDTIVNILKHIQNPCMQVMATQESAASTPRFPRDEEARTKLDNYVGIMEELAMGHSVYMEKLWQLMQVCTNHNAVIDAMNNVFIPPIQVTVTSRNQAEAEGGKPLQELATARHTPDPQALPPNCSESTRVLAALVSFVLQRQIAGQRATAGTCAEAFGCDATTMERLVTGKKASGKGGKGTKRKSSSTSGQKGSTKKKAKTKGPKVEDDEEDDD